MSKNTPSHAVSTVTAVVGGFILLVLVATTALSAFFTPRASATSGDEGAYRANVDGVRELIVDGAAAEMQIRFADVNEAELEVEGRAAGHWSLSRRGPSLVVGNGATPFGVNFCLFGCETPFSTLTLTLPAHLEGMIDADLFLGAGTLDVEGDFLDVDLDVSAGTAQLSGSVTSLDAYLGAGRIVVDLADVVEASFEVAAGKVQGQLTGTPPLELDIEVSAGDVDLALPDAGYAVSSDVTAGSLDNRLTSDPRSRNTIEVEVAVGSVALRPLELVSTP